MCRVTPNLPAKAELVVTAEPVCGKSVMQDFIERMLARPGHNVVAAGSVARPILANSTGQVAFSSEICPAVAYGEDTVAIATYDTAVAHGIGAVAVCTADREAAIAVGVQSRAHYHGNDGCAIADGTLSVASACGEGCYVGTTVGIAVLHGSCGVVTGNETVVVGNDNVVNVGRKGFIRGERNSIALIPESSVEGVVAVYGSRNTVICMRQIRLLVGPKSTVYLQNPSIVKAGKESLVYFTPTDGIYSTFHVGEDIPADTWLAFSVEDNVVEVTETDQLAEIPSTSSQEES